MLAEEQKLVIHEGKPSIALARWFDLIKGNEFIDSLHPDKNTKVVMESSGPLSNYLSLQIKRLINALGPGLITGAADEDPSTIGTYSQAGAQFGLGMLWLALFQYPMIVVIQEMCARIGLVTGSGLAAVIKKKYSRKVVLTIASLILVANAINC